MTVDLKKYHQEWYLAHRDEIRAKKAAIRAADPPAFQAANRATYAKRRNRDTAHKYGITVEEYVALVARHQVCAICHKPNPTHIDHDHRTKKVRGILCMNCNTALGHFRDDPELLATAILYLRGEA